MKKNEYYTTEQALIEQENAVLAELETEYGPADLGPTQTEPNLLSNVKGCLTKYEELRSGLRCKVDLLETIHKLFCLHAVLVPGFYCGPLRCFEDLKSARAALREPNTPVRKHESKKLVHTALPKTGVVEHLALPVASEASSVNLNELLRSLAAQVTSREAHVILIVLKGEIAA